jgi:hypothetical protein
MLTALLPILVPLAVQLIAYAFEKHYLNESQKKAFLNFIETMSKKDNTSKESRDNFSKLHEKLNQEFKP